jgi:hypothetical protein
MASTILLILPLLMLPPFALLTYWMSREPQAHTRRPEQT